jgi:aminoglycoside 6-adenylyltransferase
MNVRTEQEVLMHFDSWSRGNDLVRAAVLTGSRADSAREPDFLSDYDIELYVADLDPFRKDDGWLRPFGTIMARWPHQPRPARKDGWITRLVLFRDGVRIDFQITDRKTIAPDSYDEDYRVLIDKDGLTVGLHAPSHGKYLVRKPSCCEYKTLVHEFWWNALYVPKYLYRDELPFAASMLGRSVREEYLHRIIEWYIGLQRGWSVNTGVRGRRFGQLLDKQTWSEYASTFAGADMEDNWRAFCNAIALFRKLARMVGDELGYEYPMQIDREMTEYFRHIRSAYQKSRRGPRV